MDQPKWDKEAFKPRPGQEEIIRDEDKAREMADIELPHREFAHQYRAFISANQHNYRKSEEFKREHDTNPKYGFAARLRRFEEMERVGISPEYVDRVAHAHGGAHGEKFDELQRIMNLTDCDELLKLNRHYRRELERIDDERRGIEITNPMHTPEYINHYLDWEVALALMHAAEERYLKLAHPER